MTTTTPTTTSSSMGDAAAMVPDSLLALAKDSRYVKECQSLLLQILQTVRPRRRHRLLEQESWLLACLLCLALGLNRTSKSTTLGMEAVGLHFPSQAARWKFVVAALGTLSWAFLFSPERITNNSSRTGQENHSTIRNSTIGTNNDDGTYTRTTLPTLVGASEGTTPQNDEMLRGTSRRQFYEAQRQAMLQRANLVAESSNSTTTTTDHSNSNMTDGNGGASGNNANSSGRQSQEEAPSSSIQTSIREKGKAILFQMAQVLASAVLSPSEGPHTLIGETHQQQQQRQQSSTASVQSLGRWLAKLQLAHFCLTGRYPTWMHRLSGHNIITSSSSRLYHRPNTARLVGLLIGAQAMASLVQATSSSISRWLLERERRPQQEQSALTSSSTTLVPPIVFDNESTKDGSKEQQQQQQHRSRAICSICRMERTHPAAPSSCGHIACWNCLIQWVSTIRPACPICRAACRPQDIVALYNYEPPR